MVSSSGISFSGLGSGLDTQAIVAQLVSLERIPINTIQNQRNAEQRKLDLVGQLGDLVKTLQDRAEDLSTPEQFFAYISTVSDESVASVTTDSNAQPGTHLVDVQRMAASDRWAFDSVSTRDVNLASDEGEQISFKVGTTDYSLILDPDLSSPRTAMAAGIGLVARDRIVESIAPALTIRENAYLNPSAAGRGLFDFKLTAREEAEASELGGSLGLSPND
ncbi:MAG: flagellar cap protein FliD N-terminal domain-containing protein, partial [Planctomycetota bacterium]